MLCIEILMVLKINLRLKAWHSYINFEYRYKEYDRARNIYERFILCHPDVTNWIKYAKWEERLGAIAKARNVYERAIDFYGDEFLDERLFGKRGHFFY